MQAGAVPLTRDLVLVGGGHAHALLLRAWGMRPLPGVRLTLVNPGPTAPYTGMLPGHVAGHYSRSEMMIDLVPLARHAGARLILDRATGLDRTAGRVLLAGRAPVAYDIASLDIGITSDLPQIPGFAAHAVAAKPLGEYAEEWSGFLARAPTQARVVILGGGIGGVELALATAHRLRAAGAVAEVTVLEVADAVLAGVSPRARHALLDAARAAGIAVRTGASVAEVMADGVRLEDGTTLPSDFTLSVAGARPQDWLGDTGLALTDGFVTVSPTLQSSDPAIFAVGDCAHMAASPRPKAGVYAVRQAPVLHRNLRAALSGTGAMRRYNPQRGYLKLISTGGRTAIAEGMGLPLPATLAWWWKDRIDRAFMAEFSAYPAMTPATLPRLRAAGANPGSQPLCGGCGAKLGAEGLALALAALPPPVRGDVVAGRGDDAAVLRAGDGFQVITTDHLRAFTPDAGVLARIAAIHACGDVWAMGAAPQVALAQVTLPEMAPRMQTETLREIMAAAAAVFGAAGADVVGGHTSVGAELTVGFTVTGLADRTLGKGGLRPGDALILTKPLGSGTILAAEMAGTRLPGPLLTGEAYAGCLALMQVAAGPAATLLAPHARAMTDVTGFGLAGHLLEMLDASGTGAVLALRDIPLMPGAAALAGMGAASSLAPANRAACANRMTFAEGPEAALLFDPQTAGGLLAGVAPQDAAPVLAALHAAGIPAAIIGRITEGPAAITVTA